MNSPRQRAHLLLWRHLDRSQRRRMRWRRWFLVRGSRGGSYRITADGRVYRRTKGPFAYDSCGYCVMPVEVCRFPSYPGHPITIPGPDMALMLKTIIENDEPLFLAKANSVSLP